MKAIYALAVAACMALSTAVIANEQSGVEVGNLQGVHRENGKNRTISPADSLQALSDNGCS